MYLSHKRHKKAARLNRTAFLWLRRNGRRNDLLAYHRHMLGADKAYKFAYLGIEGVGGNKHVRYAVNRGRGKIVPGVDDRYHTVLFVGSAESHLEGFIHGFTSFLLSMGRDVRAFTKPTALEFLQPALRPFETR
jgi:hypothetical protein